MKKSELIAILKEYLNDELRGIVKEEIESFFVDVFSGQGQPAPQPQQRKRQAQPKRKKPNVKFNGLGKLGDVLNETVNAHEPISHDMETELNDVPDAFGERQDVEMLTEQYNPGDAGEVEEMDDMMFASEKAPQMSRAELRKKYMARMQGHYNGDSTPQTMDEMLPDDRKHVAHGNSEATDLINNFLTTNYSDKLKKMKKHVDKFRGNR